MNKIQEIQDDHKDIERELIELETVIETEPINYSNLMHVFKKICTTWDIHEEREEKMFKKLESTGITIPVQKILTDHETLRHHIDNINKAIGSGSEHVTRQALENDARHLIEKIKNHIEFEDDLLYTIPEDIKETFD